MSQEQSPATYGEAIALLKDRDRLRAEGKPCISDIAFVEMIANSVGPIVPAGQCSLHVAQGTPCALAGYCTVNLGDEVKKRLCAPSETACSQPDIAEAKNHAHFLRGYAERGGANLPEVLEHAEKIIAALESAPSATREFTPVGLFWQTADGRRRFCEGAFKRDDIHDNGRPIHIALLGEEAP